MAPPHSAREAAFLDVVVRNVGIGHDFPTGMPDLQECWLDVQILDRTGRTVLRSAAPAGGGSLGASVHCYRLAALDREGQPIRHGDLDRMVSVGEWRNIPAGGADLARYRLTVPENGIAGVKCACSPAAAPTSPGGPANPTSRTSSPQS